MDDTECVDRPIKEELIVGSLSRIAEAENHIGNPNTILRSESIDSAAFDVGRPRPASFLGARDLRSFSFRSLSYEIVRQWTHCSFASNTVYSLSLADIPSLDRRSSSWLVGMNIQSMVLGTSVLSYPFAFLQAGIWALPFVIIIGLAAGVSAGFLRDCLYQKSKKFNNVKRVRRTYVDVCKTAWPRAGGAVTEFIVFLGLLRNVIILILLTKLTLEVLRGLLKCNHGIIASIWAIATLPLLFIKRVSSLAWISFVGLLLYFSGLVSILIYCLLQYEQWNFDNLHTSFKVDGVGLAVGIIINSFSQHLSFPPVEGSMKKPEQFKKTLFATLLVNIVLKLSLGISAVMAFGFSIEESITGNLNDRRMSIPVNVAIAFFSYFTLPMQSFVVFDLIDSKFHPHFPIFKTTSNWAWLFLSRSVVLMACLLVAVLVPRFGLLVSFVGSVRGSLVALILPPIFYLTLFWKKTGLVKKVLCFSISVLGVLLGGLGVYASAKAVLFKNHHNG